MNRRGFSLIEAVAAIVVITVLFATVAVIFSRAQEATHALWQRRVALAWAESEIERLRARPFDELAAGTREPPVPESLPEAQGRVEVEAAGSLWQVTSRVSWRARGDRRHEVKLVTYIGRPRE